MYPFSGLGLFDSSDRRPSDEDSSRRYVGAGGGAGLQREKACTNGLPSGGTQSPASDVGGSTLLPPGLPPSLPVCINSLNCEGSVMNRFAIVDLETTGFGKTDRVIEIGIVLVDGLEIAQEWETLVNPKRDISNSHIHGITADLVSLAPTFEEVADEVSQFLHDRIFVAHNISFDRRMLKTEFERLERDVNLGSGFCTLSATGQKLSEACSAHGIHNDWAHRALMDARATALLLTKVFRPSSDITSAQIPGFSANRSPRTLSRAALQSSHAPSQSSLRRIIRNVPIDGWSGALLSYMDALCSVLSDMTLTTDERRHLKEWATELKLSDADQSRAHEAFIGLVIEAAKRDFFISESEHALIESVSRELGIKAIVIQKSEITGAQPPFAPGTRICFTGQARDASGNEIDREALHERAIAAGFIPVDSVTKKECQLVVAADKSSMSGKAKKARDYGIPVISIEEFLSKT